MSLRWIVWSVLSSSYIISFFHRIAPGVVADYLMSEFVVGAGAISALSSVYFYVYMALQIPIGAAADAIGPRRVAAVGSLMIALGSLLFALAPSYSIAFLGRFLIGIGVATPFVCAMKAQAVWFRPNEFATMSGLLAVVGTVGTIIATTPLAAAVQAWGWRTPFLISAAASLIIAFLIWFFAADKPVEKSAQPQEPVTFKQTLLTIREMIPTVWGNRQTWLGFLFHFSLFGGYVAFVGLWGVPYFMQVYGWTRIKAANAMLVVSILYTVGAFLVGALSDRWLGKRKPPMIFCSLFSVFMWALVVFWPGGPVPETLAVVFITLACVSASANILSLTLVKESNPSRASGLAIATANGGILGAGVIQSLIGYLLEKQWNGKIIEGVRVYSDAAYHHGFLVFLATSILAAAAALAMRETYCRDLAQIDSENSSSEEPLHKEFLLS
ncbi:MAG: MFS transporter [Candidatus Riflebacteria bacterium]|nr:MFS transporter [Candidatus Riflebacteria bacterium]